MTAAAVLHCQPSGSPGSGSAPDTPGDPQAESRTLPVAGQTMTVEEASIQPERIPSDYSMRPVRVRRPAGTVTGKAA